MKKLCLALGVCVALAACGGDDSETFYRGGVGESCTSRNDCQEPLICDRGVCAASAVTPVADGGATVTPTVLSGPGESCTKTADCITGYRCFNAVCALTAPVVAPEKTDAAIVNIVVLPVDGGAPSNPVLGGRGETCTTSSDCEKGLICLPLSDSTGLGICDISDYVFQPSANTCSAECKENVDCCELPLGLTGVSPEAGTVAYKSCADLLSAMTPYVGANCEAQPAISHECFLYKTYCECTATTGPWKCTTGRCEYTGTCDPTVTATDVMKGCPSQTRASFPVSSCNATTKTCAAVATTGGCRTDADCTGAPVADDPGETCSSTECLCLVASGTCYRKCNGELDCAPGYTCDLTQKLCKPAGSCTTDAFCAVTLKNAGAKCAPTTAGAATKACKLPCKSDQDCSASGLSGSVFTGTVCGADGFCGAMGCTSDAECSLAIGAETSPLGSVKMFCVPPAAGTTVQWASAITD
jgi:hypothetical protein